MLSTFFVADSEDLLLYFFNRLFGKRSVFFALFYLPRSEPQLIFKRHIQKKKFSPVKSAGEISCWRNLNLWNKTKKTKLKLFGTFWISRFVVFNDGKNYRNNIYKRRKYGVKKMGKFIKRVIEFAVHKIALPK